MRITITPDNGNAIVIAFGASAGLNLHAPANFEIEHSFNQQVVELLRSDEVRVYDRGNKRTLVSFDVYSGDTTIGGTSDQQVYSTVGAMLDAGNFSCRALVKIEGIGPNTGAAGATRYLRALVKCKPKWIAGGCLMYSFTIIGGKVSTGPPAAYA